MGLSRWLLLCTVLALIASQGVLGLKLKRSPARSGQSETPKKKESSQSPITASATPTAQAPRSASAPPSLPPAQAPRQSASAAPASSSLPPAQAPRQASAAAAASSPISDADNCFNLIAAGLGQNEVEGDQAAFALSHNSSKTNFVMLDGGTVHHGLIQGEAAYAPAGLVDVAKVASARLLNTYGLIRNGLRGFLLTSPRLNSISGMVVASADAFSFIPGAAENKNIVGTAATIDALRVVFNNKIWPNFAVENNPIPPLQKFAYTRVVADGSTDVPIPDVPMTVRSFATAGKNGETTTFLVKSHDLHVLYFGEIGTKPLTEVWRAVGPLIVENKLAAIVIGFLPDGAKTEGAQLAKELTDLNTLVTSLSASASIRNLNVVLNRFASPRREDTALAICRAVVATGVKVLLPIVGQPFQVYAANAGKTPANVLSCS